MAPWWQSAVIYQIYPRSFLDTNGDGVGDLQGVIERLDYLQWLGIDAIWLSPIYPSPMKDFSYDISDYCDVHPLFGALATFDALVDAAHARGIRVILDWVPNHTSDQHPWFLASRSSRDDPKRDWYLWHDGAVDGGPPNNWVRAWVDEPAWDFDPTTSQWYLHCFMAEQPDLNWANPEVRQAMAEVLEFWLARGVDGFRMDVIHLLGKDPALGDDPEDLKVLSHVVLNDREETHGYLREIRAQLDAHPTRPMAVGEVYLLDADRVATYYGQGDELHLAFNFEPLFQPWRAEAWRGIVDRVLSSHDPRGAWPTWVLNNHDAPRIVSRVRSAERARVAAVLTLALRGTPFLYQGEELGLESVLLNPGEVIDPGFRDGARAPMPWDSSPSHGWASETPWMTWPPEASERSVEAQRGVAGSMLEFYRDLLALRRREPSLQLGDFAYVAAPDGVLAWSRQGTGAPVTVVANFTHDAVEVPQRGEVLLSTIGSRGSQFDGLLLGDEAVLLRPEA